MEDNEFHKNLKKAITTEERKQQKVFLNSVELSVKKTAVKPKKTKWFIAASIIAIISFGAYIIFNNKPLSNQELYAENFTHYENVVVPIVRNNKKLNQKAQAFAYYEIGEFQNAIVLFNELISKKNIDVTTIHFYKANAFLMIHEYKNAKKILQKLVDSKNQEWQNESLWYLALTHLQLNETDKAKLCLQKLERKKIRINKVRDLLKLLN